MYTIITFGRENRVYYMDTSRKNCEKSTNPYLIKIAGFRDYKRYF